jgi:plasmid stability protein
MRTTLTLDDDVARHLRDEARRHGRPLKQVVNDTLRAGLAARRARPARRYRLSPVSLGGVVAGIDLDKALRLAEALEDEAIGRKLELRK